MVLDSSAVVALLLHEPEAARLFEAIAGADVVAIGAPTLVESGMVISSRLGRDCRQLLAGFLREADIEIIPFTADHWETAADAFLTFGKGRHPAALNFGDCLSYAAARVSGSALLFTGDDFTHTDVVPALPPVCN